MPRKGFISDNGIADRWDTSPWTVKRRRKKDPRMPRKVWISPNRNGTPIDELEEYEELIITEQRAAEAQKAEEKLADAVLKKMRL